MPRGIYPRTANQLRAAKLNLAKGREPAARRKAADALRKLGQSPEWRGKVSEGTKLAMRRPDVRQRHLLGLERALKQYGPNFQGGNGQEPVEIVKLLAPSLEAQGFVREYPIKTTGHGTGLSAPTCYKADFGNPITKTAIEVDGPAHRPMERRRLDEKKTCILQALGWVVLRIRH